MSPRLRLVDLATRHRRVADQLEPAVIELLRSGRYVGAAPAERAVAARMGRARGVGVASGTDALILALQAVGVRPGDQVIVPAVSFFATAGAVKRIGAQPVIVDVLEDLPLLDPDAARAALGPRTRAIVPVHLFGLAAPHPDLGLPVVDDAAQAVGGTPPRGRGQAVAVSFYPTKVLGAAGEGGMVLTDDDALADRVRALANHGQVGPHLHQEIDGVVGTNSRLDAIQSTVLLAHLADLDARVARRQAVLAAYDTALPGLFVPHDPGSPVSVCVLRHPRRDALAAALDDAGIDSAVYYPRPLGEQPALDGPPTPHARRFCDQALAVPCHVGLDDDDVQRVIDALQRAA